MSILSKTKAMKINTISPDKHKYLQMIGAIAKPPKTLHIRGRIPPDRLLSVAIVGTRKPTLYGTQVACEIADRLARKGIVIISGLAYGIDASAHTAALDAKGTTIAILAHGLDETYPRSHEGIADRIVQNDGALITEYSSGAGVRKHHFLERNRIVSGLADAVIVVEAGERSGTLSTVMQALEQGKEVFAVPGNITSPQSFGPNRLIQQGAHPVTSVDDILAVIAPHLIDNESESGPPHGNTPEESIILQFIYQGVTEKEALLAASGLNASQFLQTITMLEIAELITVRAEHYIIRGSP